MGCDIHIHVEASFRDPFKPSGADWHHITAIQGARDYQAFADIAGVRGDGRGIWKERGIPTDATETTKLCWQLDQGKCVHNPSWASDREVGDYNHLKRCSGWFEKNIMGNYYHFGDYLDSWLKYPNDYPSLRKHGYQGARIIFWFDN